MKMLKLIIAFCTNIVSARGKSAADSGDPSPQTQSWQLKPGDLIVTKEDSGWSAVKILEVDRWPDGSSAVHCLLYESTDKKPTVESLKQAQVRIWHTPIDARNFDDDWELIDNQAITQEEFCGFTEFLRLTDFPRYISFTGEDANEILRRSNEHYRKAFDLGDQGRRAEAIAEYGEAIDLFPLYYEAIDNRAFTYMELGKFEEALLDFEASLRINPGNMSAFFSRGECLMKLGQSSAAEAVFKEGQTRFPEERALFTQFLEQVRALKNEE